MTLFRRDDLRAVGFDLGLDLGLGLGLGLETNLGSAEVLLDRDERSARLRRPDLLRDTPAGRSGPTPGPGPASIGDPGRPDPTRRRFLIRFMQRSFLECWRSRGLHLIIVGGSAGSPNTPPCAGNARPGVEFAVYNLLQNLAADVSPTVSLRSAAETCNGLQRAGMTGAALCMSRNRRRTLEGRVRSWPNC